MNELRREFLDDSNAPAELSPDLRFLASRQAALAALFLDHSKLYRDLLQRVQDEGTSPELQATALDPAGNLGLVLQQLRRRGDLLAVLVHAPNHASVPLYAIDQLQFSLLMLSGPSSDDELLACLSPAGLEGLFASRHVRDWLHGLGVLAPGE
jgi:hypothetical protein